MRPLRLALCVCSLVGLGLFEHDYQLRHSGGQPPMLEPPAPLPAAPSAPLPAAPDPVESSGEGTSAGDECTWAPRASRRDEWVSVHLELRTLTEEERERESYRPLANAWALTVPKPQKDLFPAVSRDGRTVVMRYAADIDTANIQIDRMAFLSVESGAVLADVLLDDSDPHDRAGNALSESTIFKQRQRDGAIANRMLDSTTWRRLESSRTVSRACPGTPWEKLDAQRIDPEWSTSITLIHRAARFDQDGVDLQYESKTGRITIRALQADGSFWTSVVPSHLTAGGHDRRGERCGWTEGIEGFGSRELGFYFIYGAGYPLPCPVGGNGCSLDSPARRARIVHIPRAVRALP